MKRLIDWMKHKTLIFSHFCTQKDPLESRLQQTERHYHIWKMM